MAQQEPIPDYRPKDPELRFDRCCGACGQLYGPLEFHVCDLDDNEANALRAELAEDEAWAAREGNLTTSGPFDDLTDEQMDSLRMYSSLSEQRPEDLDWSDVAEWLGLNPGSGE